MSGSRVVYEDRRFGGRLVAPAFFAFGALCAVFGFVVLTAATLQAHREAPIVALITAFFALYMAYLFLCAGCVLLDFFTVPRRIVLHAGKLTIEPFIGTTQTLGSGLEMRLLPPSRRLKSVLSNKSYNYEVCKAGNAIARLNGELVDLSGLESAIAQLKSI